MAIAHRFATKNYVDSKVTDMQFDIGYAITEIFWQIHAIVKIKYIN